MTDIICRVASSKAAPSTAFQSPRRRRFQWLRPPVARPLTWHSKTIVSQHIVSKAALSILCSLFCSFSAGKCRFAHCTVHLVIIRSPSFIHFLSSICVSVCVCSHMWVDLCFGRFQSGGFRQIMLRLLLSRPCFTKVWWLEISC